MFDDRLGRCLICTVTVEWFVWKFARPSVSNYSASYPNWHRQTYRAAPTVAGTAVIKSRKKKKHIDPKTFKTKQKKNLFFFASLKSSTSWNFAFYIILFPIIFQLALVLDEFLAKRLMLCSSVFNNQFLPHLDFVIVQS